MALHNFVIMIGGGVLDVAAAVPDVPDAAEGAADDNDEDDDENFAL